jgi:hypothetical protein
MKKIIVLKKGTDPALASPRGCCSGPSFMPFRI